jgi:hypothetical protein
MVVGWVLDGMVAVEVCLEKCLSLNVAVVVATKACEQKHSKQIKTTTTTTITTTNNEQNKTKTGEIGLPRHQHQRQMDGGDDEATVHPGVLRGTAGDELGGAALCCSVLRSAALCCSVLCYSMA